MDADEVINSITTIFDRFDVPTNLRMHMYRAAAIAELVCDHWTGPPINKKDIIAVSLIHDLGNIVKFDMESEIGKKLLGSELAYIDYWRQVRQKVIAKYGTDDHEVTQKMAKELGVNERLIYLLEHGGHAFTGDAHLTESSDWDFKIHAYTDFRVGPFGIMQIEDRFAEFRKRQEEMVRRGVRKSWSYEHLDEIVASARILEKQILSHTKLSPEAINDATIQPYLDKYLKSKSRMK